jgi:tetratricopeptide (TPR) repeat protein
MITPTVQVKRESTITELKAWQLYWDYHSSSGDDYFPWMQCNLDNTAYDLEKMFLIFRSGEDETRRREWLSRLEAVSPESPVAVAIHIKRDWDAEKAKRWEAALGDNPRVALALGTKYRELKQWAQAEKYLRHYVIVAADKDGYEELAGTFRDEGKEDQWLATLRDYLDHGQDFGLQDAYVQVQIAHYYMGRHDYQSALPYADDAANTAAAWAMECAAEVHTELGDFSAAENLITDETQHYSESPFRWVAWCICTGHGNRSAAEQAMDAYFADREGKPSDEDLIQYGDVQWCEGKSAEAKKTFERREQQAPGPLSLLHEALIDDSAGDAASRDADLDRIARLPDQNDGLSKLAGLLRHATTKGTKEVPDDAAVEEILKGENDQGKLEICLFVSLFQENRGMTARSLEYLKRCATYSGYIADRTLAESKMRQNGLDPLVLESAMLDAEAAQETN